MNKAIDTFTFINPLSTTWEANQLIYISGDLEGVFEIKELQGLNVELLKYMNLSVLISWKKTYLNHNAIQHFVFIYHGTVLFNKVNPLARSKIMIYM